MLLTELSKTPREVVIKVFVKTSNFSILITVKFLENLKTLNQLSIIVRHQVAILSRCDADRISIEDDIKDLQNEMRPTKLFFKTEIEFLKHFNLIESLYFMLTKIKWHTSRSYQ